MISYKQVLKRSYYILYVGLAIAGAIVVMHFSSKLKETQVENARRRLTEVHQDACSKLEQSLDKFAILVSGIRAYCEMHDTIPNAYEMQDFVNAQLRDLDYKDSIIISFLDTTHTFRYTFTRTVQDPADLVGRSVREFRDDEEIARMDDIMRTDELKFSHPINLIEGWPGIPLNFSLKKNGETVGYFAAIVNLHYIIEPIYNNTEMTEDVVFRFQIPDGPTFDRESVYDGTTVYHRRQDEEYVGNYDVDTSAFHFTDVKMYSVDFRLGTAYKGRMKSKTLSSTWLYIWYAALLILCFFLLFQEKLKLKKEDKLSETESDLALSKMEKEQHQQLCSSIQQSLAADEEPLKTVFSDYFILNKPKEEVSGDLFWTFNDEDFTLWVIVDCTGQGITGTLSSVIVQYHLNKLIAQEGLRDVEKIMIRLHDSMQNLLPKKDIAKCGMPIGICLYEKAKRRLIFAGANRPLFIVRPTGFSRTYSGKGKLEDERLLEISRTDHGLGSNHFDQSSINIQEISLNEGDVIYSLTDGFANQLGGNNALPFTDIQVKKILLENYYLDMGEQHDILWGKLMSWKDLHEQTDDICLVGVRIK